MMMNNICELNVTTIGILLFFFCVYITATICTIVLVIKAIKKSDNLSLFVESFGIGGILFNVVLLFIFLGWLIKLIVC